jgi:hypothetical protein
MALVSVKAARVPPHETWRISAIVSEGMSDTGSYDMSLRCAQLGFGLLGHPLRWDVRDFRVGLAINVRSALEA